MLSISLTSFANFVAAPNPPPAGLQPVGITRNAYASTNVTTGSYLHLVTTTTNVNKIYLTDTSTQTMVLATGVTGAEVPIFYIAPSSSNQINVLITANTQMSVKAVSGTASSGEIDFSFFK